MEKEIRAKFCEYLTEMEKEIKADRGDGARL